MEADRLRHLRIPEMFPVLSRAPKAPVIFLTLSQRSSGMDGQFKEYPLELAEEITPEALVAGISGLTGWNLDLAGEITDGKGGMTVMFAETSALFVGPPDPQKDEFRIFDAGQLDQTILDSVQKTLQNWAVVPGVGDPDRVDIYFCGPDGGDLVLENIGVTIPHTEPYTRFFES